MAREILSKRNFLDFESPDSAISRLRLRAKGRWMNGEMSERDKDTDKQQRRERIK
jgi:hypothetical protein